MLKNGIYELLRADGSIVINKRMARALGLRETVLYSELLSRYFYFESRGMTEENGYFYNTIEDIKDGTTLSRRHQDSAIKKLVKYGLIKVKVAGLPPKRYFKIIDDTDLLLRILGHDGEEEKDIAERRADLQIESCQIAGGKKKVTLQERKEIVELIRKDIENKKDKRGFPVSLI